jgi:hypothetical protein
MKLLAAAKQDVIEIEKEIDSEFRQLPFPHSDSAVSKWHLFTVFEDGMRNTLWTLTRNLRPDKMNEELSGFNQLLDRCKYGLRYGLERICREQSPNSTTSLLVDREIIPQAYEAAASFLRFGDDYLLASRALGSYYAGNAAAFRNDSGSVLILRSPNDTLAYSALDLFIQGTQEAGTPLVALIRAFVQPEYFDVSINAIANQTRANGERIAYTFDPFLCNQLMQAIPNPKTIVPDQWLFPWGNSPNVHKVFEALQARCLLHLLSIHFSAIRFGIRGYGLSDVCPLFSKSVLVSELSTVSGINHADVASAINALTYGTDTETPDPALQPLVPLSEGVLLAPTLLILTSNHPRNYLSLHARVNSPSFDRQSELFELGMSSRIEQIVRNRFSTFRMHTFLPNRKDVGEVDLVVADNQSKTILLAELRWLLQPGDPREVNNRMKVCREKVMQLKKKLDAARTIAEPILKMLGIADNGQSWHVLGVVIVDGFIAVGPESETIPIIPVPIFEIGSIHCKNLKCLHEWLVSGVCLPQQGLHFNSSPVTAKFRKHRVRWGGFRIRHGSQYLPNYVAATAAKFESQESVPP